MKIATITFGCRLNKAESSAFEARAVAAGHELVHAPADADIIVVRGCSVTANAEKDCEKLIANMRKYHTGKQVFAIGCLPGKDANASAELGRLLAPAPASAKNFAIPLKSARAFLKVQDGCNSKCAYCIVPQFRGRSKSENFDKLLEQSRRIVDAGFTEIVLTGCNLVQYRSKKQSLADLVEAILAVGDGFRIRLGSIEPGVMDKDIIELFARNPRVCRHLHLSLQSASNDILKAMLRPCNLKKLNALCEGFRNAVPEGTLGADVICGFPGESEEDFMVTRRFLALWDFAQIHAFPYSERPGTLAAAMEGAIVKKTRQERARLLIRDAGLRRLRIMDSWVGKEVDVCVEKSANGTSEGWSGEYLHVKIEGEHPRRSLVHATISGVDKFTQTLLA